VNVISFHRQLERVQHLYELGQLDGAIDQLKQVLTEDPDSAEAHAWLALCLLRKRRLHAAQVEAGLATTLGPDLPLSHLVAAEVALAKRDFKAAGRHIETLLADAPENPVFHRLKARWLLLTGRRAERLAVLEQARALAPDDPETLADLSQHCADTGEIDRARQLAGDALRIEPENHSALVAMGWALLLGGDKAGAREHAISALRSDPLAPAALALLTSIKTRSNPLLGAWWHYATWMERIGPTRSVIVLLAAFVLYRLAVIAAQQEGATALAGGIQIAWLAIVVYSFVGPILFRKALRRELESVELRRF
jgi:tetratricopeptide (TPR) repeat protein